MTLPINKMRDEEKSLTSLNTSLVTELRVLGHFIPGTINKVYIDYSEKTKETDRNFKIVQNFEVLQNVNKRIENSIDIITNMEAIITAELNLTILEPTAEPNILAASLAPKDQPKNKPLVKKNKNIFISDY